MAGLNDLRPMLRGDAAAPPHLPRGLVPAADFGREVTNGGPEVDQARDGGRSLVHSLVVHNVRTERKRNRTLRTTEIGHSVRMIELPRHRLMKARAAAGFATPSDAARGLRDINVNTLISHENGNRDLSRKAAEKYAKAFGADAGWLLYGKADEREPTRPAGLITVDVPLLSWVSAGELAIDDSVVDLTDFPSIAGIDLPSGNYIALRVDGASMNKISPPGSIIFVNTADRRLVMNGCYVIADESGAATYKRYRPSDAPQFQPASYEAVEPPTLRGAIRVIGRVRRSLIDM